MMNVAILLISAIVFASNCECGDVGGFPSSYSSNSGHQYHPEKYHQNLYEHGHVADYHVPVIKNGVPVETPEVQAAKAHFFAEYHQAALLAAQKPDPLDGQYAEEKHYDGHQQYAQYDNQHRYRRSAYLQASSRAHQGGNQDYGVEQQSAYGASNGWAAAGPVKYDFNVHHHEYSSPKWTGPEHIPVIDHNGVPVDTPEVQHARKEHLAALHAEYQKHQGWKEPEHHHQKW